MKRKLSFIVTAVALAALMLFGLCACGSTWDKVKSAFENEGYAEQTEVTDALKSIVDKTVQAVFSADESSFTVHILVKKGNSDLENAANALAPAVIVEGNSNEKMEEALKKHVTKEDAEDIYNELQKLDFVNGNCVLCGPVGLQIFKSTK